jgi:hypothetical protein
VVVGFPSAPAAKSTGIPTIGANSLGDPVETKLIDRRAHPGGNITGLSDVATVLSTKRNALEQGRSRRVVDVRARYFRSAMSAAKIRRKIARRAVSRLLQYAIIGLAIVPWK